MQCLPFLNTLSRSRRRPRTVHSAGECRARRGRSPSCTHTIFRESRPSYTSPDRRRQAPSDTSPHCRPHPQSDRNTRRIVSSRPKAHKEAAKLLIVRNEITCLLTSIKLKEKSVSEPEEGYRKLVDKANEIYMAVLKHALLFRFRSCKKRKKHKNRAQHLPCGDREDTFSHRQNRPSKNFDDPRNKRRFLSLSRGKIRIKPSVKAVGESVYSLSRLGVCRQRHFPGRCERQEEQTGLAGRVMRKEVREGFRDESPIGMILPCIRRGYLHKKCSIANTIAL